MQTLLSFEQATVDAEEALARATRDAQIQAKLAAKAQREERKLQEEREKLHRRLNREEAYRRRHPPGHAQCGINWYPAGSGWTHCHTCGQTLIYTTDRNAPPQVCAGRRS